MLDTADAVGELDDLVGVPGGVAADLEPPVAVLHEGGVGGKLYTLVGELTNVHQDGGTTGGAGNRGLKDLVDDALVVVSQLKTIAVVHELVLDTELPLMGGLRADTLIAEGGAKLVVGETGSGALVVGDGGLVDCRGETHDTVGGAQLTVVVPAGTVRNQLAIDEGSVE